MNTKTKRQQLSAVCATNGQPVQIAADISYHYSDEFTEPHHRSVLRIHDCSGKKKSGHKDGQGRLQCCGKPQISQEGCRVQSPGGTGNPAPEKDGE